MRTLIVQKIFPTLTTQPAQKFYGENFPIYGTLWFRKAFHHRERKGLTFSVAVMVCMCACLCTFVDRTSGSVTLALQVQLEERIRALESLLVNADTGSAGVHSFLHDNNALPLVACM